MRRGGGPAGRTDAPWPAWARRRSPRWQRRARWAPRCWPGPRPVTLGVALASVRRSSHSFLPMPAWATTSGRPNSLRAPVCQFRGRRCQFHPGSTNSPFGRRTSSRDRWPAVVPPRAAAGPALAGDRWQVPGAGGGARTVSGRTAAPPGPAARSTATAAADAGLVRRHRQWERRVRRGSGPWRGARAATAPPVAPGPDPFPVECTGTCWAARCSALAARSDCLPVDPSVYPRVSAVRATGCCRSGRSPSGRGTAGWSAPACPGTPGTGSCGHRGPRSDRSARTLQYRSVGSSRSVVSAGERIWGGGMKPAEHGGGSPRSILKSSLPPSSVGSPPPTVFSAASSAGNTTSACSSDLL